MLTELYLALTLYAFAVICMIAAGIDGIRYARILRLDWPIYVESCGWLAVGLVTISGMIAAVYELSTTGLPVGYKGIGILGWLSTIIWTLFMGTVAIGKHIAVRNVKIMEAAKRESTAKLHNAAFRLKRELDA